MSYQIKEVVRLHLRDLAYLGKSLVGNSALSNQSQRSLVLCNSFPKSGTHLLYQILYSMPQLKGWDTDILAAQSLSGFINTATHIHWKLNSAPNEHIVRTHLMYYQQVLSAIKNNNCKVFFIYRDLRDVAISHARWVCKERLYYLHDYYKQLDSFDEQLMCSIRGIPRGTPFGSNVSAPDIGSDFLRWKGWIDDANTFAVKFEDLVGARGGGCEATRLHRIEQIAAHLEVNLSKSEIESKFSSLAMNPEESHTYKMGGKGKRGGWKNIFKQSHKEAFKGVAGNLLVELGYEQDLDW